jgi:hypothetical protein
VCYRGLGQACYLLRCRCLRRAVRDQSRGRDVDSEDRAGPHEQSVEKVADPHLKAEQEARTPGRKSEIGRERAWRSRAHPPPQAVDHHAGEDVLAVCSAVRQMTRTQWCQKG